MANKPSDFPKGKYMSMVSVGAKGQIVIPKQVRDMFGIKPGDRLMLLADEKRGIAINKYDFFDKIAKMMFHGISPDSIAEDENGFSANDIAHADEFSKQLKNTKEMNTEE